MFADRTSELRKRGFQGRRLGPVQMTTDTAVRVTRLIVQDQCKMSVLHSCTTHKAQVFICSALGEDSLRGLS